MESSHLYTQIGKADAFRENRLKAARWVLEHPESLEELLTFVFSADSDLAKKAAWTLEFVFLEDKAILYPYLEYFIANISEVKADQVLRPVAHICEHLCVDHYKNRLPEPESVFTEKQRNKLNEYAFLWLLSDKKVACKVRAMTCLFYLGTEFSWIHPELKAIIDRDIHTQSAGYKARGKHTLRLILRYEKKKRI